MNANDIIESYITDVATQLPRKQRNDVAFELRTLLQEELQAKAVEAGRQPDTNMAVVLLNSFGHPNEVAARYRPTLTIIDPSDGTKFLRLTIIGLAIIWSLGLLKYFSPPLNTSVELLRAISLWWGNAVIPSFWWPGVLVVSFGLASWARQRRPHGLEWKPRAQDCIFGGRAGVALGLLGMTCGIYLLIDPTWILDIVWSGKAAPAAYAALSYSDGFLHRQAPVLLTLIALNIPLFFTLMLQGHWTVSLRRIELVFSILLCAAMTWTVLDGPILMTPVSDKTAKFFMGLIVLFILLDLVLKFLRQVKPQPNQRMQA